MINDRQEENSLIDITFILDDMWKEFLKVWWLLLVIVSLASSIVYFYVKLTWKPEYIASATYTVETNSAYGMDSNYYNQTAASNLGLTLQHILKSNTMKTIIAKDLNRSKIPGQISVSNTEGTNLITITVKSSDAEMAYQILQSVINNYPSVAEYVIGNTVLEVLDETGVPSSPSNKVNLRKEAGKGCIAGICIDLLFLFILAITKHTIKKEEDFKAILNVDCYGAIPRARFKKRGKKASAEVEKVMTDNPRIPGSFIEAIRNIRSKLEKDALKNDYKVWLISSSVAGEGKSTVAANLALALSRKGRSVVLVDLDLRSPAIADRLFLPKSKYGTLDVLEGKITLEDALVSYGDKGLRVLPGGKPIMQTKRILNQPSTKDMIAKLRTMADYVILDTPPCAILSDAMNIAGYADAAVFVVRQDYARVNDIMEGVQNLNEAQIPICGCVLNSAEVGITGYGYSQGYGYGRYGYGYGDKKYGYGYGSYGYGEEDIKKNNDEEDYNET